jgi:hypothetical protein
MKSGIEKWTHLQRINGNCIAKLLGIRCTWSIPFVYAKFLTCERSLIYCRGFMSYLKDNLRRGKLTD